ncbi:hypothetical protein [Anaerocolumna chitinilytica]|uniref:Uncharacterized protein n=1 Tax=Anaerocolumna chitinilytica TaxID=1727145 RepID=A0A7I8DPB3_9FIRM|nr:hypothetical protein [Anaerocolumna chitinilytica]BCJ98126.1 hypothetical protein bsdcttw_11670 [Anaerocolumna chitinilytica]
MPSWKKIIFVNAIKARMIQENRTAEDIITEYTKLTETEKIEILANLSYGGESSLFFIEKG